MEKVNFTEQELNNLIEALDSWESKDSLGEFATGIFGAIFSDKLSEEEKSKREAKEEVEKRKRAAEKAIRKEQSIIMKAKLIQIKNKSGVNELIGSI